MKKIRTTFLTFFLIVAGSVMLNGKNLTILETIDPSNHELLDVEISGNYMIIPGGLGGASVFDVSDPVNPIQISTIFAGGCQYSRSYNWEIDGDFAYGAARDCGIVVVDFSDPENPQQIELLGANSGLSYEDVEVVGYVLIAAVHGNGIVLYDVTNPHAIQLISQISSENAWSVASNGTLVYVADGEAGLTIIDISDPENPFQVSTMLASGSSKDVRNVGSSVYLAVGNVGGDLFNVSDPAAPVFMSNYNTSNFATRIAILHNKVAVSDWDDVEILQWNGTELEIVGYKNTGGRTMAIGAIGEVIYSAEWRYLQVFEYGEIDGADLDLSRREISFPFVEQGDSYVESVILENNGNEEADFSFVFVTHEDFVLDEYIESLEPGSQVEFEITYTADTNNAAGIFGMYSNDPDEPEISVQLNGNHVGVNVGEPAPNYTLPIVYNGNENFQLSDYLGSVVVMAFFATW